jgi:hypothetical protein
MATRVKRTTSRTPVVSQPEPPVSQSETVREPELRTEEVTVEVNTRRERMTRLMQTLDERKKFCDELKKSYTEMMSEVRLLVKDYETELKHNGRRVKRVKKERDPSKPVLKNGIAKPQVVSDELSSFLFRHFKIPKGSLVSRTGALSKENGLSRYISDKNLRRDGEVLPDSELVKLLGEPVEVSKDGKTRIYKHKTIMRLIGRHFPQRATQPTSSR